MAPKTTLQEGPVSILDVKLSAKKTRRNPPSSVFGHPNPSRSSRTESVMDTNSASFHASPAEINPAFVIANKNGRKVKN